MFSTLKLANLIFCLLLLVRLKLIFPDQKMPPRNMSFFGWIDSRCFQEPTAATGPLIGSLIAKTLPDRRPRSYRRPSCGDEFLMKTDDSHPLRQYSDTLRRPSPSAPRTFRQWSDRRCRFPTAA
jgi:hypothetical protein